MKKINSGICFGIIIICVCLLFETGYAATYYVKNSGDDNASGLDENTAWRTINKVNSFVFLQGDTVLFKRGDTFADRGLRISNVENFTIADYGEGEKPLFDGNKIKPILITDSKNVTIRNIDISGQEWYIDKSSNMEIVNVEGLIIDGVYGNGHTIEGQGESKGKTALSIKNCSGEIEIKNCELFNWGPYDLLDPQNSTDFMGIVLSNIESGEYNVHNNKIYNVTSDCIHLYLTKAKGAIHDNILYNAGEDGIDVKASENVEIYDNEFYRTTEFLGEGGSGSGGLPTYISVQDGMLGEGFYAKNNTIRSNSFKNGDCAAIKLSKAENTNIYENVFSNTKTALFIGSTSANTSFHHNIIENPQSRVLSTGRESGSIYENNGSQRTQIYNNTIYNETGSCKHLITLDSSNEALIYNNIVYQNNSSEDAFGLYRTSNGTEPIIRDNYWYNPGKLNRIWYKWKTYTADMQEEWNIKHPGDKFGDPLMNDPEEGDYSLYDRSLKIGAVYDEQEEEILDDHLTTDTDEVDSSLNAESLETTDEITLSVVSYKVRGAGVSELTWSGAASGNVDIRRDGSNVKTTKNDGEYTDKSLRKGGGSATYQVCEAGTSTCSNSVSVSW